MRGIEKLLGWMDRMRTEQSEVIARWSAISAKAQAGSYEPKEALADWLFFSEKCGLWWLPDPGFGEVPEIRIIYSKSIDGDAAGTVGVLRLPVLAGNPTTGDLPGSGNNKIATSDITLTLIDRRTRLLVHVKKLSGVAQGTYTGPVNIGQAVVATLTVEVGA